MKINNKYENGYIQIKHVNNNLITYEEKYFFRSYNFSCKGYIYTF